MCRKRQVSRQNLAEANCLRSRSSTKKGGKWTLVCREYTLPRSDPTSALECALNIMCVLCPVLCSKTTNLSGLHHTEVPVPSKQNFLNCSQQTFQRTFCDQLANFFLRVDSALSGGLSIPQSNTGCVSPTVRLTWPEGVLQWWT